jgi:hypothetical protein
MQQPRSNNFLEKLKQKWGLKNLLQVVLVLLVFALTGSSVLLIKPYLFALLGIAKGEATLFQNILYLILILPLYQILLLLFGFILGQFNFFWEKEKQLLRRLTGKKIKHKSNEKANKHE